MRCWLLFLLAGCTFDCGDPLSRPSRASSSSSSMSSTSPSVPNPPPVATPLRVDEVDRVPHTARARDLAQRCDEDDGRACWLLASAYERGTEGLEYDEASARRLYRRACRRVGVGCTDAARLHEDQRVPYLERGCEAGDQRSCQEWADAVPDSDEAKRQGCNAGWLEACTEPLEGCNGTLADCMERIEDLATSQPDEANQLARLTCNSERTAGCVLHGGILMDRDPAAAQIAYQWACGSGRVEGCEKLRNFELSDTERLNVERRIAALTAGAAASAAADED